MKNTTYGIMPNDAFNEGNEFSAKITGTITAVHIRSGDCINAIQFSYRNHEGIEDSTDRYGNNEGELQSLYLEEGERITRIHGFVDTAVTSLVIETDTGRKTTFGHNCSGKYFSCNITEGQQLTGLYGRAGKHIYIFDVFTRPDILHKEEVSASLENQQIDALGYPNLPLIKIQDPVGGTGGTEFELFVEGLLTTFHFYVDRDGVVSALRLSYLKPNGRIQKTALAGGEDEVSFKLLTEKVLTLEEDEKITNVIVFLSFLREDHISSLVMCTNKNRVEFFGTDFRGPYFSFKIPEGEEFGGFIGCSGWWVDSLGIFTVPDDYYEQFYGFGKPGSPGAGAGDGPKAPDFFDGDIG